MVFGISISSSGTISDFTITNKTTDVLEFIRKKFKNPNIQFQGKIQDPLKDNLWISVFASTEGSDDNVNQHMLPSPFDEETYCGSIIMLSSSSEEQDEYDPNVNSYTNLKSEHYELLYQEWTFVPVEEE